MPIKWPYLIGLILMMGVSFCLLYSRIEDFFVFYPERPFDLSPEDLRLDYEEVYFNTDDGKRLDGWFFPLGEGFPVILFCHGNAGNISHRIDNVRLLLKHNLQVFIFDYRGYGKSSGRPSEKGVYRDGLAAYDYLIEIRHLPPSQIIPFGRSIGAAVAIEVALKKKVRSIIIESAFTSAKDLAKTIWLFSLFSYLLPAHYNNLEKIPHVGVPKLFIHSETDEIVPFSMGQSLFGTAKMPKYFYPVKAAGHNDTYMAGGDQYFQTIMTFAREASI